MNKVTINDIAKITGYSKSTISAAINDKPGVGKKAKEEILKVCEQMNFVPCNIAKGMSTGSFQTIGLIVRDYSNPFYARLGRAVEKICDENDYTLLIVNTDGSDERLDRAINKFIKQRVDGIIVDVSKNDTDLSILSVHNIPTVVFGLDSNKHDSVFCDDIKAAYVLAKTIVKNGYDGITYVKPSISKNEYVNRRSKGISMVLKQYPNTKVDEVFFDDFSKLLDEGKIHKAIMAFNDDLAYKILKELYKRDNYINEYLVTGFDNLDSILHPLTSVDIPVYSMGLEAAKLLFERIKNPDSPIKHIKMDATIIWK